MRLLRSPVLDESCFALEAVLDDIAAIGITDVVNLGITSRCRCDVHEEADVRFDFVHDADQRAHLVGIARPIGLSASES